MSQIITALQVLKVQLEARGADDSIKYDEVAITGASIRMTRDGKTLRIPLIEVGAIVE